MATAASSPTQTINSSNASGMNIWHTKPAGDSSFNTAMPAHIQLPMTVVTLPSERASHPAADLCQTVPKRFATKDPGQKKNTDFFKWPFWSALFELNVWGMEPIDDTRSHSPCSQLRETCAKYKLYISSLKIKKQKQKKKQTQNLFSGVGSVWSYIIHVFILSPEANPSPMLSIKSFIVIRPWVIMVSQTSSCDASPVQSAPCWSHSLQ